MTLVEELKQLSVDLGNADAPYFESSLRMNGPLNTLIDKAIEKCEQAAARIEELEALVYHTAPGELMFGGEGWTWKQAARAAQDRVLELEAATAAAERGGGRG